jgi:hypothetical protein
MLHAQQLALLLRAHRLCQLLQQGPQCCLLLLLELLQAQQHTPPPLQLQALLHQLQLPEAPLRTASREHPQQQ